MVVIFPYLCEKRTNSRIHFGALILLSSQLRWHSQINCGLEGVRLPLTKIAISSVKDFSSDTTRSSAMTGIVCHKGRGKINLKKLTLRWYL